MFAFCKVTTSQVERVMKTLIKSKATGIHNIPNKILKDSYQVTAPFLSEIFNCSISNNVFPDDLKIEKVSPIHKSVSGQRPPLPRTPDKNPLDKTKYILHKFLPWSCFILLDQLTYD